MRGNPEEGDRGLRGNCGVDDMDAGDEWVRRRRVGLGRQCCESNMMRIG